MAKGSGLSWGVAAQVICWALSLLSALAPSVAMATTVKARGVPLPPSCTKIAWLQSAALRRTPWLLATPRAVPSESVTLKCAAFSDQDNR